MKCDVKGLDLKQLKLHGMARGIHTFLSRRLIRFADEWTLFNGVRSVPSEPRYGDLTKN